MISEANAHSSSGATSNQKGTFTIDSLWRYPVKSLKGERLKQVSLETGRCFPFDRAYAIENGGGRFDPKSPSYFPKVNFLNLMSHERLALLDTEFDDETKILTIFRNGRQVAKGDLATSIGRNMLEQFFAAFMSKELIGPPRIHSAPGHHFTDTPDQLVHIINLASLKALELMANESLTADRFRANILLAGNDPWVEQQWVGKTLQFEDVKLEIIDQTSRCAAINVNSETGKRGRSLPGVLTQQFKHDNFGVYGRIINGGKLTEGMSLQI